LDLDKKILVTGGTGFVGSYLLRYLVERGYRNIYALRRPSSPMDLVAPVREQIHWIEGDLLDIVLLEDAMDGVDQVYHCAGVISYNRADAAEMMEVNVTGTANIVNVALAEGIEKLVHVSSIATLGRTKPGEILDENSIWQRGRYNTRYAVSKFLSEQEVWRGYAEGLPVGIVNPSIILGSGRWSEGALRLFQLVWNNFPFYATGGNGFIDVRDVVRFMIRLMESDTTGQRFVLNGANLSYRELLTSIAHQLGRRPPYIRVPAFLRGLAWRIAWLQAKLTGGGPFLTKETAANASQTFSFNPSKSVEAFDFKYIPIEETITATSLQFIKASQQDFPSKILPLIDY
jgi:dihydroflavonol-4-reductase